MNRIRKGYESRFGVLLRSAGARRTGQGLNWLFARGRRLEAEHGLSEAAALTRVHDELARKLPAKPRNAADLAPAFFCDSGLGGLARWLRGAGYEAFWEAAIDDSELLRRARETHSILLTTDSMLMERRLLRDGIVPGFWLPPTLSIGEQLQAVFREFGLKPRDPRCMSCGGSLREGDKEKLRDRIPPRTYRWLDTYFSCTRCDKLFWHGTHWERIQRCLQQVLKD